MYAGVERMNAREKKVGKKLKEHHTDIERLIIENTSFQKYIHYREYLFSERH